MAAAILASISPLAAAAPETDSAQTPVAAAPSAFEKVENRPVREPARQAKLSGQDLVRSQQHALTVPADQLPALPAGTAARMQRTALPEGISPEDAELAERMAMVVTAGCQFYLPSPHAVCGAIRDKYNAMGGTASWLGYPTSPEYQNPGNTGARSEFVNGSIYWSAGTGAHPITLLFMTKWSQHGWEAGWMGYPTSDEISNGDNIGSRQEFQTANAAIYWHNSLPDPGLAVIGGAIRDKWGQVGWETPGGLLGYPTTDEIILPDGQGRMNRFQRGVIYWHPNLGAQPIVGQILDRWSAMGYETSTLGYPTSGELVNADGLGRRQLFQNGVIYWQDRFGAHELFGEILNHWAQSGYESGWLGYPLANIGPATGGFTEISQLQALFENGGLFLNTTTNEIFEGVRSTTFG
ncbi:hypothetical protein GS921_25290 [Rhodococcus hoagii]|nr:hypothetical protein [Prescottella equi]